MNSQKPESREAKEDGWSRKKKTFCFLRQKFTDKAPKLALPATQIE
jgi:hypothetical protein